MPVPLDQRLRFFVFVIESPSAVDLYHRRSEGEILRQAIELNQIPCVVKTAISLEAFEACLKFGLTEAMNQLPGLVPLLHISAHGSESGIQLSDGYLISWPELKEHLRPLNNAMNNSLLVCMSSCQGYSGTKMAMHLEDNDLPYFALVGCGGQPTWSETAIGFATFYHQLATGEHVTRAVEAMRIASGNSQFWIEHAEETRRGYIEYVINQTTPERTQGNLEQQLADEPQASESSLLKLLRDSQAG